MTVGVIGLGLIGGSLARALSEYTAHTVLGFDRDADVVRRAIADGAIGDGAAFDAEAEPDAKARGLIARADVLLVALYPGAAIAAVTRAAGSIRRSALVVDCCGVKQPVCAALEPLSRTYGFTFIGGHPMAGLERFGYDNGRAGLFQGASMILTPAEDVPPEQLARAEALFAELGFMRMRRCTPEEHDRMIAYTSQLAHIVSSAYVQSDASLAHIGFSAGSFQDMTRVARLYEPMWVELFLDNPEPLLFELNGLIERLGQFAAAIGAADRERLYALLHAGRVRRERITEEERRSREECAHE